MNYKPYKHLPPFKGMVLQNFPFIGEDFDAITNYQLLCKIVEYLKNVIANELTMEENINNLYKEFVNLKNYVDNYFDNLDVQEEINNKLDEMTESGELTNIISNYIDPIINEQNSYINDTLNLQNSKINALASGSPLVASSISGMLDTARIYVNTTDGYWYYYNGTNWIQGGVYQSSGISDGSITTNNLQDSAIIPKKIYNVVQNIPSDLLKYTTFYNNTNINATTGQTISANNYVTSDFIYVGNNKTLFCSHLDGSRYNCIYEYDTSKNFLNRLPVTTSDEFILQDNTRYIRYAYNINPEGTQFGNTVFLKNGNNFNSIPWLELKNNNFKNNTISPYSLIGVDEVALKNPFMFGSWINGYRLSSGNEVNYPNYSISNYVKIKQGSVLTFNKEYASPARLELYDENKNLVAGKTGFGITHTIETNATYMRIAIPTSEINTLTCISSLGSNLINIPWLLNSYINKNGLVYGDSLWSNCKGNYNYTNTPYNQSTEKCIGYQQYLEDELGLKLDNQAVSGTTIKTCYENQGLKYPQNITTETLENYDFVIISFGRNDSKSMPLGTLQSINSENFDTNTFYGCYQSVINTLLSKKPNLKFILWTMTQSNANGYGTETINSQGLKQIDYVNAVKNIAKLYSANIVDMYENCGINELNLEKFTFEGVHLTNEGYKFTKDYYVNKMKNYL